jgi:23S rRNA (cytosine1962-C5)-methyltransferase
VRDEKTRLDASFFRSRIERAIALRASLGLPSEDTNGFRVVHAEGDGLPGLVIDRYGDVVAIQLGTIGMKQREALVHEAVMALMAPRAIVDRTSAQAAKIEGFHPSSGVVCGEQVRAFEVVESGLKFRIPLELGQKTGFYFDQRSLRARVEQLARNATRVLDVYAFVGAFAIAAARGGARQVIAVDESARAIEVGAECAAANGVGDRVRFAKDDARHALSSEKGSFDLVIVDPPRLAPTRGAREQALVAYTRLAENACRATTPGGVLVFCSCSAAIDLASLTRALAAGATRANVLPTVLERWFQGADHPVPAAFGEGLYLKALVARVDVR